MVLDLAAETEDRAGLVVPVTDVGRAAHVLVFDSGLGGMSVYPEIVRRLPGAAFTYLADDAVFPYGALSETALVERVMRLMEAAIARFAPDAVVIACSTASTLVLGPLRARWPAIAFVGTVPAIKPAAAVSRSRMISVLATPGTVAREYTRDLVRSFAADCSVTLVGAVRLASLAEAAMRGHPVDQDAIVAEIRPAFVTAGERRTDAIVLACTHYPLLLSHLEAVAPWPVAWIDPAAAIARRVVQVLPRQDDDARARGGFAPALFTSDNPPGEALIGFLASRGVRWEPSAPYLALNGSEVTL